MKGIEEPEGDRIEEELIVSDSSGHVLLLEDLVVIDTELEVGGTVPKGGEITQNLLIETSPEVLLGGLCVLVET